MRTRSLLAAGAVLIVGLAAACGGDGAAPAPADEPPASGLSASEPATSEPAGAVEVAPIPIDRPGARETTTLTIAGNDLELTVVLPQSYTAGEEYPILLALPPGGQGQAEVDFALDAYWAAEAQRRGWIVVSPVAPDGTLFFRGSEAIVPELLDAVAATYPPEGGRFHVGGISNGGLSSFRVALRSPERFVSLVVLPGHPPTGDDLDRIGRLAEIPVRMFVGENDTGWVEAAQAARDALDDAGGDVELTIVAGEGHIIRSLTGAELFDLLDAARS